MVLAKIRHHPKQWLKSAFPIVEWLPKYKLSEVPYDLIAGLTVALTVLPMSLAYAQMASLKAETGLYSSFIAHFVYIFIGTSKDAVVSPSEIISILLGQFNALNPLSSEEDNTYSVILTFTSGIILMLIGVLKLGFIVNLFSIPVVSGFATASCLTIIASQLNAFFGLKKGPDESPAMFIRHVNHVYEHWHEIHYVDMYFGISALTFLIFVEYFQKIVLLLVGLYGEAKTTSGKRLKPILLETLRIIVASRNIIVFVTATGIAYYLLSKDAAYEEQLVVVGYIKKGFPVPRFPRFVLYNTSAVNSANGTDSNNLQVIQSTREIFTNLSTAIVIMPLMMMMELFAVLKALARKNGYRLDPTNELVAVGLGNFLQSFIQAYPVTAATAKCAMNDQCRVKSHLSALVSIVLIIVAIEQLTGVFYYVPKSVLAAILIAAAHHLFDYQTVIHIYREYKPDLFMFFVTLFLCLFFDLAYGIVIAILMDMITFLRPVAKMEFCVTEEPLEIPGVDAPPEYVKVIQLSHGMKYPSADKFTDRMSKLLSSGNHHFVIDCRFVTGIDFSGLQAWRLLLRIVYQKKKHVIFANLQEPVRRQLEAIGLEHFRYVEDIESAVNEYNTLGKLQYEQVTAPSNLRQQASFRGAPRLNRRISIVSPGMPLPGSRGQSRQGSGIISAEEAILKAVGAVAVGEDLSNYQATAIEKEEVAAEKERKQRLMKTLSFQAHFLHDIPLSNLIDSVEDSDEEKHDDKNEDNVELTGGRSQRAFSLRPGYDSTSGDETDFRADSSTLDQSSSHDVSMASAKVHGGKVAAGAGVRRRQTFHSIQPGVHIFRRGNSPEYAKKQQRNQGRKFSNPNLKEEEATIPTSQSTGAEVDGSNLVVVNETE